MTLKLHVGWKLALSAIVIVAVWLGVTIAGNTYLHEGLSRVWIAGGLLFLWAVTFGIKTQFVFGTTVVRFRPSKLSAILGIVAILAWIGVVSLAGFIWNVWLRPEWMVGGALLVVLVATLLRLRAEHPTCG